MRHRGTRRGVDVPTRARISRDGRRGRPPRPEAAPPAEGPALDRFLVGAVVIVIVALVAIARYAIDPTGPLGWSWAILLFCLLLAAAVGRALLGPRTGEEEERPPTARPSTLALWSLLLAAAILPNLATLHLGLLADDFGLLAAAKAAHTWLDTFRLLPLRIFYRPLSLSLWWLGLHLWGGSALGYHLVSLLLHAANTCLLFLLARRYLKSAFGGAMAALLFAVHPVHIEATAWLSAQPDLLSTGFILLSMWFLEKHLEGPGRWRTVGLAAAVATFFLALLSKETAAAFPAVVLVRLLIARDTRRALRVLIVFGAYSAAIAAYLVVRFALLGKHWLGGYGIAISPAEALLSQTPMRLVGQLLFPLHLTLFKSALFPFLWVAAIVLLGAGLVWWIRTSVSVPGPKLVHYTSYLLAPMIPLALAGLPIGEEMAASRYAYLPSIGLALLFGAVCAGRPSGRLGGRAVGAAVVCLMAALSFWYVQPWKEAARLRDKILAEDLRVVSTLPASPPPSTVFFRGLPVAYHGAAVFAAGCHAAALSPLLNEELSVQDVGPTTAEAEVMRETKLVPGEYVVGWDADSEQMVVERSGGSRTTLPQAEDRP